jgi:hypothetical protein
VQATWTLVSRDLPALDLLPLAGQVLREVNAGLDIPVGCVGTNRRPITGAVLVGKGDGGNRVSGKL